MKNEISVGIIEMNKKIETEEKILIKNVMNPLGLFIAKRIKM
jgi:hypothetical protein